MSETEKINRIIPYMMIGCERDNQLAIKGSNKQQTIKGIQTKGISTMEIKFGKANECIVTNEFKNGKVAMIDKKTGELIGYLKGDGDIGKKLDRMDKKALKGLNNLNDKKDTGDKEK